MRPKDNEMYELRASKTAHCRRHRRACPIGRFGACDHPQIARYRSEGPQSGMPAFFAPRAALRREISTLCPGDGQDVSHCALPSLPPSPAAP